MDPKYKFLIAGGTNTAVTFALYALLVTNGLNYNLAMTTTYLLGIVLGFLANRLWTFSNDKIGGNQRETNERYGEMLVKSASIQFMQYLFVYMLIFIVNFLTLNLLVQALKLNPILAQLFAVSVSTVCSYFLQKSWVFKR